VQGGVNVIQQIRFPLLRTEYRVNDFMSMIYSSKLCFSILLPELFVNCYNSNLLTCIVFVVIFSLPLGIYSEPEYLANTIC
jgi:hypothetical protein